MIEALKPLSHTIILHHQNVSDIQYAIKKKYPESSPEQKALVFASVIHKIIDRHIINFDKNIQAHIKNTLLQQAIQKGNFDITAYDIVESCQTLPQEAYLEPLTDWINTHQSHPFSVEELKTSLGAPLDAHALTPEDTDDVTICSNKEPLEGVQIQPIALPLPMLSNVSSKNILSKVTAFLRLYPLAIGMLFLIGLGGFIFLNQMHSRALTSTSLAVQVDELPLPVRAVSLEEAPSPIVIGPDNHLQEALQYKAINEEALSNWLTTRNSLLADDPYFDSILNVAREFNINPLLMFAITGQEQGFVPKDHPKSMTIINNPFNVYGSWEDFNTNITDTSKIAARTILNLSKGCPEDADPIKWLNKQYAEDPNWHIGVSQILKQLEKIAGMEISLE